MKLRGKLTICICYMLLGTSALFSQAKPSRQSSIDAFSKGDYEQAYVQFTKLLDTYPKDALYKYYTAACLVELKRDIPNALTLLEQALGSGSLRSLPNESLFYLGRARQYTGNYREAEKAYNRFTEAAGRKIAKEMKVPEFIRQCRENTGKLDERPVTASSNIAPGPEVTPKATAASKEKSISPAEAKVETTAKSGVSLPAETDRKLGNILENQYKADSVSAAASSQKQSETSKPVSSLNKSVAEPEISRPVAEDKKAEPAAILQDTVKKPDTKPVSDADTTIKIRTISSTGSILSVFEVLAKVAVDPKEKIVINPEPVQGLVYRIQVAVFRNPVSLAYFKGLSPVYGFKAPGSAVTTYYIGVFRKLSDAAQARSSARAKGFKDAFVTAQMDGKTVSLERAEILEKEWGSRSLFSLSKPEQEEALDTLPPTLVFRVEVARSPKPLKEEVVDDLRKVAGSRSFDIQPMSDNTIAYLIGDFITFESANEYASLLIRNGYRDSKVVAWLGKKQIDVETARKLFESLK